MRDIFLDWVERHRKLVIFIIIVSIIFGIMLCIRTYNLSKKENNKQEVVEQESSDVVVEQPTETTTIPQPTYDISLNNRLDNETTTKKEPIIEDETLPTPKPNFDVSCKIWKHVNVPDRNDDGSSYKKFLSSISLSDFNVMWGTNLDINDMNSTTKYYVGSIKETDEAKESELKSVSWIFDNLNSFKKSDAIHFTNLYTIGSLSNSHVALLCSYTWHSVFGLDDTLVMFEDISGTLNPADFTEGATFSATVFVHNVKVEKVNGQDILCVQYNVFK